jgi:hypothetical protein
MDGELRPPPYRRRLPHRRNAITETIIIGNMTIAASIEKSSCLVPKTARAWLRSSRMPQS